MRRHNWLLTKAFQSTASIKKLRSVKLLDVEPKAFVGPPRDLKILRLLGQ